MPEPSRVEKIVMLGAFSILPSVALAAGNPRTAAVLTVPVVLRFLHPAGTATMPGGVLLRSVLWSLWIFAIMAASMYDPPRADPMELAGLGFGWMLYLTAGVLVGAVRRALEGRDHQ